MFASSSTEGIIGGRTGADNLCETQRAMLTSYDLPSAHVHAFISVSASDQISNMATNYSIPVYPPIAGPTGIEIAENWHDLISKIFINSPQDANVTSESPWWSGSNNSGSVGSNTCIEWNSGTSNGNYGTTAGGDDFFYNGSISCTNSYQLLCICWE